MDPPGLWLLGFRPFILSQDALSPPASPPASSSPGPGEEEKVVQGRPALHPTLPLAPQFVPPAHALVSAPVGAKLTGW